MSDSKRARVEAESKAESKAAIGSTTAITSSVVVSKTAEGTKYIGTHSGTFHCDEALACAMLKQLPEFAEHHIVRTRDYGELEKCDIVVDVGGVYDAEKNRFDHHQREFKDTYEDYGVRMSSAGLVFKHYGPRVLAAMTAAKGLDDSLLGTLVKKVYSKLILEVDAIDNGVEMAEGELKYRISTGLSSRVGRLNPNWNQTVTSDDANAAFVDAMLLTFDELHHVVASFVESWLPARETVYSAMKDYAALHESREIVLMDRFCPFSEHLDAYEKEHGFGEDGNPPKIKYILWPDGAGVRVRAVAAEVGSFACRKPLPKAWRGLRGDALVDASGIPDANFVHAAGFIGGAHSREAGLRMAIDALKADE